MPLNPIHWTFLMCAQKLFYPLSKVWLLPYENSTGGFLCKYSSIFPHISLTGFKLLCDKSVQMSE